jgi:Ribonuclease HepT-like
MMARAGPEIRERGIEHAVHDYQKLNLDIVRSILVEHLDDFLEFTRLLLRG